MHSPAPRAHRDAACQIGNRRPGLAEIGDELRWRLRVHGDVVVAVTADLVSRCGDPPDQLGVRARRQAEVLTQYRKELKEEVDRLIQVMLEEADAGSPTTRAA